MIQDVIINNINLIFIKSLSEMQYRYLGPTGIKVSVISYGNWLNSNSQQDFQNTIKCVKTAWDLGINFFDTAEIYGFGEAQKQMGQALKRLGVNRSQYVLSTKIWKDDAQGKPNRVGLSRKHLIQGIKNSLKRLDHTYVDVLFAHRPDVNTPMEQTVRAFDWIVRKGLAHYWGTSEWDAQQIAQAHAICDRFNLIKPVVEQPQYNILIRQRMEIQYARLFQTTNMGTTIWSPLYGGILTGKFNKQLPENHRFEKFTFLKSRFDEHFKQEKRAQTLKKLNALQDIAKQLGCTMGQLSMAWTIYYKNVSTALTGASNPNQLIETVKAVQVLSKFTPQIDKRIQEIFKSAPTGKVHRKTFQIIQSRRLQQY